MISTPSSRSTRLDKTRHLFSRHNHFNHSNGKWNQKSSTPLKAFLMLMLIIANRNFHMDFKWMSKSLVQRPIEN